MKTIESIIEKFLMILFFLFFLSILVWSLNSEEGVIIPTMLVTANRFCIASFMITSLLCGIIFPLWNVKDYYRNYVGFEVRSFIRNYKKDFYFLFVGYAGLLVWCYSSHIFDKYWTLGLFLICGYIVWLFIPDNPKKSPNSTIEF